MDVIEHLCTHHEYVCLFIKWANRQRVRGCTSIQIVYKIHWTLSSLFVNCNGENVQDKKWIWLCNLLILGFNMSSIENAKLRLINAQVISLVFKENNTTFTVKRRNGFTKIEMVLLTEHTKKSAKPTTTRKIAITRREHFSFRTKHGGRPESIFHK